MNRRGLVYTEILCVFVILLVLWLLFVPNYMRATAEAYENTCRNNLREIGGALRAYAADYDSAFPAQKVGLDALGTGYVPDPEIFKCAQVQHDIRLHPEVKQQVTAQRGASGRGDYAYRGGFFADDLPLLAIVADSIQCHDDAANVLYLDGHVRLKRLSEEFPTPAEGLVTGAYDINIKYGGVY
ncbi:MAG: prepilin-type N-terminal cleavage/methylation domain-containing protein [Armatimonadota bacterium]